MSSVALPDGHNMHPLFMTGKAINSQAL